MSDRGASLWLAAGVLGIVLGAAAVAWDVVQLAVLAGAMALVAGVAAYRLVGLIAGRDGAIEKLTDRVGPLEAEVERESKARQEAEAATEAAVSEQLDRTAVRDEPDPDALTDAATGLYSEGYFLVAADARVAAARRHLRPVAIVLMEVIEGLGYGLPRPAAPTHVAEGVRLTLRESDTACRLGSGAFGLLLEDTPENGAIWTVERLRRNLADDNENLTLWAGIACYPAHGFDTRDLLARAESALTQAKEWRQDRIEVATGE